MAKKNFKNFELGENWEVKNVRKLDFGTFFTLQLPGLSLYNLRVIPEGKTYNAFVAMPQSKGKNDDYFDQYKIYLSDEDNELIIAEVDRILDEEFEKEKAKGRKARK